MNVFNHPHPCPKCKKIPCTWKKWERLDSRELYFIGCRPDKTIASGISPAAAGQAWERLIGRCHSENLIWKITEW